MKKTIGILVALVLVLLAVTVASAGHTSDQLVNAGWTCVPAGPSSWTHCFSPSVDFPDDLFSGNRKTLQVKVFGVEGSPFLGTELLIHSDLYNDNEPPCAQDGGGAYDPLAGTPYMACHHFHTGHH